MTKQLQKQRTKAAQTDSRQRKVESEKLDGYGWMMSLDTVRTPEEILLVKQRFERLEARMTKLPARIERVLRLRLGINCNRHTLAEVAEQYGVNKERIRQLEVQGMRVVKRWTFIEEKPEEYLRGLEATARAYAERKRLEHETEVAEIKAEEVAYNAGRYPPLPPRPRTILDEIVREQRRAHALELEYRGWAEGRERTLLPASVLHGMPYAYKLRRVEPRTPRIERDWLHVATEGLKHGA